MKPWRPSWCLAAFGVCLLTEPTEPSASPSPPSAVVFPPWTHPPEQQLHDGKALGSRAISTAVVVETQAWQPGIGWTSSQWSAPDGAPSLSPVELSGFEHTDGWAWCGEWAVDKSTTAVDNINGNVLNLESSAGVTHSSISSDADGTSDKEVISEDLGSGDGWCYSAPVNNASPSDGHIRWRRWIRPMRSLMTFSQPSTASEVNYNLDTASSGNSAISSSDGGISGHGGSAGSFRGFGNYKGSGVMRSPLQPHTRIIAHNDDDDLISESSPARALQLERSEGPTWADTAFATQTTLQQAVWQPPVQKHAPLSRSPLPQPPLPPQPLPPQATQQALSGSESSELKSSKAALVDNVASSENLESQAQQIALTFRDEVASLKSPATATTAAPIGPPPTAAKTTTTAPRSTAAIPETAPLPPSVGAVTSAPKRSSEERRVRKWAARLRRDFTFTGFVLAWFVPLTCPQMCGPLLRLRLGHCFQSWALNEKLPLVTVHLGINRGKIFAFFTLAYRIDTYLAAIDWMQQYRFLSRRSMSTSIGSSSSSTRTSFSEILSSSSSSGDAAATATAAAGSASAALPTETTAASDGVAPSATTANAYAPSSITTSIDGARSSSNLLGSEGSTKTAALQLGGGYQPGHHAGSALTRPPPPTPGDFEPSLAASAGADGPGTTTTGTANAEGAGHTGPTGLATSLGGPPSLASHSWASSSSLPQSSSTRSTIGDGNSVSGGVRRGLSTGVSSGSSSASSGSNKDAHPGWASPQRKLAYQLSYVGCSFGMKYEWFSEKHGAVLAPQWTPFNGIWVSAWPYAEDVLRTAARALPVSRHSGTAARCAFGNFWSRHRKRSNMNNWYDSSSLSTSSSSSYADASPFPSSGSVPTSGSGPRTGEAASALQPETAPGGFSSADTSSTAAPSDGAAALSPSLGRNDGTPTVTTATSKLAALLATWLERPWQLWLTCLATKLCQLGGAIHCKSDEGFGGIAAFQVSPVFLGLPFVNWPRARALARAQFRSTTPPPSPTPASPQPPLPVSPPPLSTSPLTPQPTSSTAPLQVPSTSTTSSLSPTHCTAAEAAKPLSQSDAPTFYNVAWPRRTSTHWPHIDHGVTAASPSSETPLPVREAVHLSAEPAAPHHQSVPQEPTATGSSPGFKNGFHSKIQANKATDDGASTKGIRLEGHSQAAAISQAQTEATSPQDGSPRSEAAGPQRINLIPGLPPQEGIDVVTRKDLPLPVIQGRNHEPSDLLGGYAAAPHDGVNGSSDNDITTKIQRC